MEGDVSLHWGSSDAHLCDSAHRAANFDFALTGDIQLHNRSELLESLRDLIREDVSDQAIVLAAYRKWGTKCGEFLLGEFAFVVRDHSQRLLFCCRDHLGVRPFFYWLGSSRMVFASRIGGVLSREGVPRRPNLRKIVAVTHPGGPSSDPDDTFHAGIHSLGPGSWMTVSEKGVHSQTYWSPGILPGIVPRSESEAFEAFGELLHRAVVCRVERSRTPAILLSGGLDSSSLVSLAARWMNARDGCVSAFAGVLGAERRGRIGDEREFIDEFRNFPGVRLNYVTAAGRGPFDDIRDARRFESTFLLTSRTYLYESLAAAALEQGADLLIEGNSGELGPTCWGEPYYLELAVQGRWPTLIRELAALKRVQAVSPIRNLTAQLYSLMRPHRGFLPFVFLTPEVRRTFRAPVRRGRSQWPDQRRHQLHMIQGWMRRHVPRAGQAERSGIRTTDPYLDKRVVEFCLAAPPRLKVQNGYRRFLIRKALEGILPRRIQWRTSKTPFSPDYFLRYNAQLEDARQFVADISPRDPVRSIVDVELLDRQLQPVPEPNGNKQALSPVPTTIYLISFLRQFAEFRS